MSAPLGQIRGQGQKNKQSWKERWKKDEMKESRAFRWYKRLFLLPYLLFSFPSFLPAVVERKYVRKEGRRDKRKEGKKAMISGGAKGGSFPHYLLSILLPSLPPFFLHFIPFRPGKKGKKGRKEGGTKE